MHRKSTTHFTILAGLFLVLLLSACSAGDVSDAAEAPVSGVEDGSAENTVGTLAAPEISDAEASDQLTSTALAPAVSETLGPTDTPRPRPPTKTPESGPGETGAPASDVTVNGVSADSFVVIPDETKRQIKQIFDFGQALGRDPKAFSKLGDSLIASPNFLTHFDTGPYRLGEYEYLQPAIDYYAGSFERYGVALREGLHAWAVFDPMWANKKWCEANETLLECEFRYNNPSLLLILLGTNDSGNPPGFEYNMRQVIDYCIERGVIPVLVTKADRFEGPDNTNNNILRQLAADKHIPLVDFDVVAESIPGRGLKDDQIHLTIIEDSDYTQPEAFQSGHGVHNLITLMMLEAIRQTVAP